MPANYIFFNVTANTTACTLPLCRYDANCQRNNPTHFTQFSHSAPNQLRSCFIKVNTTSTLSEFWGNVSSVFNCDKVRLTMYIDDSRICGKRLIVDNEAYRSLLQTSAQYFINEPVCIFIFALKNERCHSERSRMLLTL